MRHLYPTGERLHKTHINKLSLGHSEVWSTARISEASAGKLGATDLCNTWKWKGDTSPSREGDLWCGDVCVGKSWLAIFF